MKDTGFLCISSFSALTFSTLPKSSSFALLTNKCATLSGFTRIELSHKSVTSFTVLQTTLTSRPWTINAINRIAPFPETSQSANHVSHIETVNCIVGFLWMWPAAQVDLLFEFHLHFAGQTIICKEMLNKISVYNSVSGSKFMMGDNIIYTLRSNLHWVTYIRFAMCMTSFNNPITTYNFNQLLCSVRR